MADNRNWTETLSSPGPIKKSEAIYMVSGRLPSSSIRTVTVGSGISPDQPPKRVADFNCRWGLSPRPEDQFSLVTTGVRGLPRKIVTGCATPLAVKILAYLPRPGKHFLLLLDTSHITSIIMDIHLCRMAKDRSPYDIRKPEFIKPGTVPTLSPGWSLLFFYRCYYRYGLDSAPQFLPHSKTHHRMSFH